MHNDMRRNSITRWNLTILQTRAVLSRRREDSTMPL